MSYIIAVDAGTSSLRSVLFDPTGKILFMSQKEYSMIYPRDNWVEQDPAIWKDTLISTLVKTTQFAAENNIKVCAITLTSPRSSVFAVDSQGKALCNAIMWHDKRCIDICKEYVNEQSWVYKLTGMRIDPMFSAPKMTWIKQNRPELYNQAYKFLGVHEYLLYLLCGNFVTDHSVASRSLLFNLHTLDWDERLMRLFQIDKDKLCGIVEPGTVCGGLRLSVASEIGLAEGIPVITAGGDQQCASMGRNIYRSGQISVTTGTGSYIVGMSDKPVFDLDMGLICNVAAIPGKYVVEASVLTSGIIYKWFVDNFLLGKDESESIYQEANLKAASSPTGSNGVILMPYFKGRGSPSWNPQAKGSFFNITLSTTIGDLARAILEGIALELSENIDLMHRLLGNIREVRVSGGMTISDLFNQIQSDAFNMETICYENCEATALGAWISSEKAMGLFSKYEDAFLSAIEKFSMRKYKPNIHNHLI